MDKFKNIIFKFEEILYNTLFLLKTLLRIKYYIEQIYILQYSIKELN